MSKRVFLYKEIESEDRDCVKYISNIPTRFDCGHYFGCVNLQGSCFSMGLKYLAELEYSEIQTILTEDEIDKLIKFDEDIHVLGYGIKEGDERYLEGISLCKEIQPIYDKLNGVENSELFEEVMADEFEIMKDEHNLDDEDLKTIFDFYTLEYRDRSVVGSIFEDVEELGREEAESFGYLENDNTAKYFNFQAFGEDLLDNERYVKLKDGRVASLMY